MARKDPERTKEYKREWLRQDRAKNPEKYLAKNRELYARSEAVRERSRLASLSWRAENKDRHASVAKKWRTENVERRKAVRVAYEMKKRYGLTMDQIRSMRESQGQCCAICALPFENKPRAVHVDHCHRTGVIRGILCNPCNLGIGKLRDEPEILRRAADYIDRYR